MASSDEKGEETRVANRQLMRFAVALGVAAAILGSLPFLIAWFTAPAGSTYTGSQLNADDHMVYAAWMRQAMEGHFLFDNRFTVDPQPGLTVHLYFWALGQLARLTGIPFASMLGRAICTFLFVWLCAKLIDLLGKDLFTSKLALTLATFGGGFGFLVWQNFGVAITRDTLAPLSGFLLGRLPNDVWQPEAFVFPSLLTNGLFMASLCLMLGVLLAVLSLKNGWRGWLSGFICIGLLMNIHSYDVLLLTLVLIGFLVMALRQRAVTAGWIGRVALMALGAVPPALWFMHVLRSDAVFEARAATETYSQGFRQLIFSLLPAFLLAVAAFWKGLPEKRRIIGVAFLVALVLGLIAASSAFVDGYWLGTTVWICLYLVVLVVLWFLSSDNAAINLIAAWSVVGLIAPYFPALFQRKLTMGLGTPWLILAAIGFAALVQKVDRPRRNLMATLVILVFSATSLRWFQRDLLLMRNNVSNTTLHPVYLSQDASRIIDQIGAQSGPQIVLAPPGLASPTEDPDRFQSPYLPDLNPFLSGLAGAYTYAGHWSETPDYGKKRTRLLTDLFLTSATPEMRQQLLKESHATYLVAPVPRAFPAYQMTANDGTTIALADLSSLGQTVYEGSQFKLIKLPPP